MKGRFSVTVALLNSDNGFDIEFDSYNDALYFAHASYKSPDCYSFDVWEWIDDCWVVKYAKTKQGVHNAY